MKSVQAVAGLIIVLCAMLLFGTVRNSSSVPSSGGGAQSEVAAEAPSNNGIAEAMELTRPLSVESLQVQQGNRTTTAIALLLSFGVLLMGLVTLAFIVWDNQPNEQVASTQA